MIATMKSEQLGSPKFYPILWSKPRKPCAPSILGSDYGLTGIKHLPVPSYISTLLTHDHGHPVVRGAFLPIGSKIKWDRNMYHGGHLTNYLNAITQA